MVSEDTGAVVVFVAPTPMAAEVVLAKLKSFGIEAALSYQSLGRVIGLTIDGWGATKVLVPPERADEAKSLLADEGLDEDQALDVTPDV